METKTAAPGNRRSTATWVLATFCILALLLGGGVLYFVVPPLNPPPSRPDVRPDFLKVPLGSAAVAGVKESGFYGPEFDHLGKPFRWTDGKARLVIPLDRNKSPRALWVILQATRPQEAPPVALQVVANGKDLFSTNTAGVWEKTLDLSDVDLGDELTLDITSSTFVPRVNIHDTRSLGVRINGMRLLGPGGISQEQFLRKE